MNNTYTHQGVSANEQLQVPLRVLKVLDRYSWTRVLMKEDTLGCARINHFAGIC